MRLLFGIRLADLVDVGHVWGYQEPADSAAAWYGFSLIRSALSCSSRLGAAHHAIARSRSLRGPPDRLTTLKRGSIRGIQSILGAPYSPYSSGSSIDGRASPSPSIATSTHEVSYAGPRRSLTDLCSRECTVPWLHSSRLPSVSRPTCPTRSSVKRKKTKNGASRVMNPVRPRLVSRTKNLRCSVHHGQKKACCVASNTGNLLESAPGPKIGSTSLWSFNVAS